MSSQLGLGPSERADNLRAVVLMNVAMLTFTANDTLMKLLTLDFPLSQAILIRGALTTFALFVIARRQSGVLMPRGRDAALTWLRSLAELGATLSYLLALMHLPVATLSAIVQSAPLAVTLGAALIFGEKIGWRRLTAIALGFAGVMLIVRPGAGGLDVSGILGLISVGCIVVRDLSTRRIGPATSSAAVAAWAGLLVTLTGLVWTLYGGWQPVGLREAALILGAAINLIIGYLTMVMVMRVGDIGFVSPFRYTALLWAIILGWLAFGTLPDRLTFAGAAIVVMAGLFTFWRERRIGAAQR